MSALTSLKVGMLPTETYRLGLESFPIATVDFIVRRDSRFLLIKREGAAHAGEWFFCGGRQRRGERMTEALDRIAQREVGVRPEDIESVTFTHCQDFFNPEGMTVEGPVPAYHSIWHFHVIDVNGSYLPRIDETCSEFGWFSPETLPEILDEVREALTKAGIL